MRREISDAEIDRTAPPAARLLANGRDWCLSEFVCHADASCRPFEEQHERVTIAAVVEGSFNYHTDTGKALLHPGAFMLGNHGACYECGHQHSAGDRCVALQLAPDYFAEIAASAAASAKYAFTAAMLPSMSRLLPQIAAMEKLATAAPLAAEETVPGIAATIVRAVSDAEPSAQRLSPRDERRVSLALRYIEDHAAETIDIEALADVAGMSKYHFLRVFRRAAGVTPYQFLLGIRMRRAAARLAGSAENVSAICYDSGFGDLSTFNHRFRDVFGVSPMAFRKAGNA